MEYEFRYDTITGQASAAFSYEHQVFGPWLEVEVGYSKEKLTMFLEAIENISLKKVQETTLVGHEYTVNISDHDVLINANGVMNESNEVPELLLTDDLNIDESSSANCGLDDFRELLLSWGEFARK
ncbi:MAG: YacL family protein [Thalassotalea sp.]